MRIIRYELHCKTEYGVVENGFVHRLDRYPYEGIAVGEWVAPLDAVRLLPPCEPSKIISVGGNFREHCEEFSIPLTPEPSRIFVLAPWCLIGPGEPVELPSHETRIEFGAELALIVGRHCKPGEKISPEEILFGYTCVNNVWAKDPDHSPDSSKCPRIYETFCPLGPWIVRELELRSCVVRCRVDGRARQEDTTEHMVFPPEKILAFLASKVELFPGDVIQTGTPGGVGLLHPGNYVEVDIEGIGVLANPCVAASKPLRHADAMPFERYLSMGRLA